MSLPIPENPLENYQFLPFALDRSQLQDLEDAAYRRENLRRALPFDGPAGLFFAQGPLTSFLEPGAAFVPRQDLLAALQPAMLTAAREHGDIEPYVDEIARNETARLRLERLRNPLVNVELIDPDGKINTPSRLKFTVDFKEIPDNHGAIPLAGLDALSPESYELVRSRARVDARQLSDIALLQARTEFMFERFSKHLAQMKDSPKEFPFNEVRAVHDRIADLTGRGAELGTYLWANNQDQAATVASLQGRIKELVAQADAAFDEAKKLRHETHPDSTWGEVYTENEEDIRENRNEDWEEGGVLGYGGAALNEVGLGANKLLHGLGNIGSGGYMDIHAARTKAYRDGDISYDSYTSFHVSDLWKGALQDLAVALPGYGGVVGKGAAGVFGLEEGTTAYLWTEGSAVGFTGGGASAAANDLGSLVASKVASSEDERRFQSNQIGGPGSWLSAATEGFMYGGPLNVVHGKLFPRPGALGQEPPLTAGTPGEPGATVEPQSPASETNGAGEPAAILEPEPPAIPMEPPTAAPGTQPSGLVASFKRSLLHKFMSAALAGSEPMQFPIGLGPTGDQLLSVTEDLGPVSLAEPVPASPAGTGVLPPGLSEAGGAAPAEPAAAEMAVTTGSSVQPDVGLANRGESPAPGTRTMTRAQWKAQSSAQRDEKNIDDRLAGIGPRAGAAETQAVAPEVVTIDIQGAIRQAIADVRNALRASGVGWVRNATFGTMLHAALARILRAMQLPADVTIQVEQPLGTFANFTNPRITARNWLRSDGSAYQWLESALPRSVLDTEIGNLRLDLGVSVAGHSLTFDLTSREQQEHLAKTTLYAALLAIEGEMTRVQEYYWVQWDWRGQ